MKERDELIRVFSGSEIAVMMLKEALDEIEIGSFIQNDFQSGMVAGIGGFPSFVDLYIQQSDFSRAEPLINEFTEANK
jgi:hypothetical protein